MTWWVNAHAIERASVLRGWTQGHLAEAAGVDPGTLGDLIKGRRRPTFGTLQAVCSTLGLGLGDVVRIAADESELRQEAS